MLYEYKCRQCGGREISRERGDSLGRCRTPSCNGELRRLFSFHTVAVAPATRFKDHLNQATGLPTASAREHRDNLRRLSEQRTLATGIEHNYVPVDHRDREACGVSDQAEEHLARNREQARKDKIAALQSAP